MQLIHNFSSFFVILIPLFWILAGVILYFIIKLAVRNGINESNLFKNEQQKREEKRDD
ncbi:hypothetical protein ACWN8V_11725 [Vagococcus elongatus]|uniref:hypothetical protein n=1 Tax=Vagococcus elongatus TaxID=180344 RepID=UPI001476B558|nr:hypothetical protein [Vagococcus elongatus]